MTHPLIDIHNVTVYRQDLRVLDRFSFQMQAGERIALLGGNGAGKSTLLKLVTRELYPVVGEDSYIRLNGCETVNLWQLRAQLGFVSQDLQVDYAPWCTGTDVALSGFFGSIGAHDHLQANDEQRAVAEQVMEKLDIASLKDRMYQRLSTGQQRRFLLARAMVHNPDSYILDEPTSGLDIAAAHQLLNHIRQAAQRNKGLLLATHHIEEIIPEINRVVMLKDGNVIADGLKADVLTAENLTQLYGVDIALEEIDGWYRARCI